MLDARANLTPSIRNFAQAIDRQRQALERIPLLRGEREDLLRAFRELEAAEAAALAVEVGEHLGRFGEAARAVSVPVLRADPLREEFRIYESRAAGADGVLLRAAELPRDLLARLLQSATSTHMAACVICANEAELSLAAQLRAPVVALDERSLRLGAPPRTLVLALSSIKAARGRADAVLDASLQDANAFRAALAEEG